MLKNFQTIFKLKNFIAIFLTPILLLGFFAAPARAEWANHLVISGIQVTGSKSTDEFVELYNPTNLELDIGGWKLQYKSATGDTWSSKVYGGLPAGSIIMPHKFFLLAGKDYAGSIVPDYKHLANWSLSDTSGHIRIINNNGEEIDKVGYGSSADSSETVSAHVPGVSESLVRKPGASGAGNGEDTNNNFDDFILSANFIPRNSQSAAEPAIENSPAPGLTPSSSPSSGPAASPLVVPKSLPVAEAGPDREAVIGENLDFDGSDSFDPLGKELVLTWDFGDKTGAKGENAAHLYKTIGEYLVILKVNNGEAISQDSLKVKIIAPEFSDQIILNEILPNPIGADKDGEWIELYNSGDKKVNLKGWILATSAKTSGKQYIFAGDNFFEAKSYLAIKRSESGLVLANESGKVSLIWPPEKIMSEVSYGAAKEGKSYAFVNNAWQWADAPTPGQENSLKVSAAISKSNKSAAALADASKNTDTQAISSDNSGTIIDSAAEPSLLKSAVLQTIANTNIEDFLNKLVMEKVDSAIAEIKADEALAQEKTLALAGNSMENASAVIDKEAACKDFCAGTDNNISNNEPSARNNPWFYGDLALSALCLFLVWRYQELRKKMRQ